MKVFDYVLTCSDEERKVVVEIFKEWFHEHYFAGSMNVHYMNLERGDYRASTVSRAFGSYSREKYFDAFNERVVAHIEGK